VTAKEPTLKSNDIFIVGHSLGGVGARHFIDSYPQKTFAGLAFYGTQYNGDSENFSGPLGYPADLKSFPIPLLCLSGELDFLPYSHPAILYDQLSSLDSSTILQKPIIIVPGMDHSAFCPGFKVKDDIVQEIDENDAIQIIGEITGTWIDIVSNQATDSSKLLQWIKQTAPIVQPFISAQKLASSWCKNAQLVISGLDPSKYNSLNLSLEVVDSLISLEFAHTEYSFYSNNILSVMDVSYSTFDGGYLPNYASANQIACKLISDERVAQQLGYPVITGRNCYEVNNEALSVAKNFLQSSWPNALSRWEKQGKGINFAPDSETYLGPQWLITNLDWQEDQDNVTITSISLYSHLTSPIYPGNHYCKVISPAKLIEWITTFSLKNRYTSN